MSDADYGGPWLMAAVFCQQVLHEKDDVVSLVRLVDRFVVVMSGPDAPEKIAPTTIDIYLFIALKSGFAQGSGELRVVGINPSQQAFTRQTLPVFLEGEDRGFNANVQLRLQVSEEGLYWFDVFYGDRLLTRMPLRIIYQRVMPGRGLLP